PEPFEPGKRAKVAFTLPDIFHTFRTGHRVMIQIQSSWFPLVEHGDRRGTWGQTERFNSQALKRSVCPPVSVA
ncbi:MAG: CocE/NonD family hydrolase C-terminal non-catalytic domain-containing protein, partial [Bryobacteraceae bacterium]